MNKNKTKKVKQTCYFLSLAAVIFGFAVPFSLLAAGPALLSPTDAFKWYEFGKVNISATSSNENPTAGSVLPLSFSIKNQTKFPITEGTLYVKIYRERENNSKKDYFKEVPTKEELNQGVMLIDQFFVAENLALDKGGTINLKHDYTIPSDALGGRYKVVSYFQSIKKMNLQGLSFTDDVPGGIYYYQVSNPNQSGTVEFDRGNVNVNGELYDFNSMLKIYGADEEVKVSALISNATNSSQRVSILRSFYSWDGLDEKNNFGNEKDEMVLAPGEKKNLEFSVPKTVHPVTYVMVDAKWGDNSHSMINIRFARNVDIEARINSIGITEFPLKTGAAANIFVTAHEVKQMVDFDSMFDENGEIMQPGHSKNQAKYRIDATLKDEDQSILQSYFYEGNLSQDVSGYESNFNPAENYNYLVLEAKLTNLNTKKVMDTVSITYYCQNKNFIGCSDNANFSKQGSVGVPKEEATKKSGFFGSAGGAITAIIVLIVFLALAFYLKAKKIVAFLLFVLTASLMWGFLSVSNAKADSISYSPGATPRMVFKSPLYVKTNGYNYFWMNLSSLNWNITYSAVPTSDLAGLNPLPSGSSLNRGDSFYITDTTHSNANAIFYTQSGSYADTPYGYFRANAARDNTLWNSVYSSSYNEMMSTSFSFNPLNNMTVGSGTNTFNYNTCTSTSQGAVSMIQDANAAITCVASGTPYVWKCTVQSFTAATSGTVKMVYGCTYGSLYYKAWRQGQTNSTAGSCANRTVVCNYYEGRFQTKLFGSAEYGFNIPDGVCDTVNQGGYEFPGNDGCMSTCTHTGPSACNAGNGTDYEYRPIVPQQEITFTYNINQPDFAISSFTANPASGDAPLNGVQLTTTLVTSPPNAFPSGTAVYSYDCNNGQTFSDSIAAAVGSFTPVSPHTCNYNPAVVTTYHPTVTVTIGSLVKSAQATVTVNPVTASVSCGTATNERHCLASQYTSNLCENSSVHDSPTESNGLFNWTCGDGSVACSAEKYCSTDAVWQELPSF
jgi:hypothetical protein